MPRLSLPLVVALTVWLWSVPVWALAINWKEPPQPLPELVMEDRDGTRLGLDDFAGEIVVLNLWATWCAPCKVEMPTLAALQEATADRDVRVVALAIDRAGFEALDAFMAEADASGLLVLRDESAAAARALGAGGLPVTLVIDREGRERFRHAGYADWGTPDVVEAIEALALE